jgi:[glutamine synthetase] adenylyltransferase / [glutamine synthetase]-adenylyl-L-tyrosine phosphorylase
VSREEWKKTIQSRCAGVKKQAIEEFFRWMDENYFADFSPDEVSSHIGMSAQLTSKEPVQVRITPGPESPLEFKIVIVAFDYLSEFSILCGLLSAFGLDIHSGDIYSFGSESSPGSPRKLVDIFYVRANPGAPFDDTRQQQFVQDVNRFGRLLATGDIQEPREQLNRFLIESIEKMDEPLGGLLSPIEIRFDNDVSERWTVMETQSKDAFALLYAVSNALGMSDVYIHKAKIRVAADGAKDLFFIADRWGRKIEKPEDQERLKIGVGMITQFTSFLPEAPDPAKAMRHFDQFVDKLAEAHFPGHVVSFLAKKGGMNVLAHLLGSSDFLWDDFLSIRFSDLVPVLEDFEDTPLEPDLAGLRRSLDQASTLLEKRSVLNRFKEAELFRIDSKHLIEPGVTLMQFSQALTDLAEGVLTEAAKVCYCELGGGRGAYAICALGKFGGCEVGYASDLELVFVHESEEATSFFELFARRITEFIETRKTGIFNIDLRLRPYGDAGLWSIPFSQFASYYSETGEAAPFERQALIKLRCVTGDAAFGRTIEAHRDDFTYSGAAWDSENALHLRRRQMRELVRPGEINVKYSAGGIVDIEYAVQYLQLLYGYQLKALRTTNTLEALHRLRDAELVSEEEHSRLHASYLFLRNVIDALRIVRGDASDLVLPPQHSEEFKSLARRLGYRDKDRMRSASLLAADLRQEMEKVHEHFLARYDK